MKRELAVKGSTLEEKMKSVEVILQRMSRKMTQKVIGILPVSPVFDFAHFPDPDGIIMRRLFPVSGRVTKAGIAFDSKGKKPIKLTFRVENDIFLRSFSSAYMIKKKADVLEVNFDIKAGDKITVGIELEEDEIVEGIWIGFVFEVALKDMSQKEFLLEELERMVEEEVEYASEGKETQEREVSS